MYEYRGFTTDRRSQAAGFVLAGYGEAKSITEDKAEEFLNLSDEARKRLFDLIDMTGNLSLQELMDAARALSEQP